MLVGVQLSEIAARVGAGAVTEIPTAFEVTASLTAVMLLEPVATPVTTPELETVAFTVSLEVKVKLG